MLEGVVNAVVPTDPRVLEEKFDAVYTGGDDPVVDEEFGKFED